MENLLIFMNSTQTCGFLALHVFKNKIDICLRIITIEIVFFYVTNPLIKKIIEMIIIGSHFSNSK